MAKLELTFVGVTGTLNKEGQKLDKCDITMITGTEQKEGYCYYDVSWTKTIIVKEGDKPKVMPGKGKLSFALSLQNACFTKKMYSPNEIIAQVQIVPGTKEEGEKSSQVVYTASIPKADLESSFINKKVTLKCDDLDVCTDYYIQEIEPRYKKDAMYVTFKMYSPDYLLTQQEYCRSFVTKKLGAEILTKEIGNYKLPYDDNQSVAIDFSNEKHLKKGAQEHIFPYLVQYNESFYDFLKRTTNRWGEFLYYEDKTLYIGYKGEDAPAKCMDFADAIIYSDLTLYHKKQASAGKYHSEAPIDKQILDNKLKKGSYDVVKAEINSLGDYSKGGDVYLMKKMAAFLTSDKSLWPFLLDQGIHDGISLYKANKLSDKLNTKFDDGYFNNKDVENVVFGTEQFDGDSFNEFSEHNPILTIEEYAKILEQEKASGKNSIVVDFDTNYPNIKLGQVITYDNKKYLVVKVEGFQPERLVVVKDGTVEYAERAIDTRKVCYKITAIPQSRLETTDTTFYPSMISEGHVRRSGTQLARVVDVDDPLRQNRVRVKFDWQSDASEKTPSPWLIYSNPTGSYQKKENKNSNKGAIVGRHYVGEPVLVDFACGNVERPYVVGSVETNLPTSLLTNNIVLSTPASQSIKMSDGIGLGVNAMLASLNPGVSILQAGYPGIALKNFNRSEYLEGSIEFGDKYGFWSIKGSTNDRNVTIKSPWGDVKINAFTGITISAPNGDVKIQGKNVSIEAGSNLTLKSGKNIDDKFLVDSEDWQSGGLSGIATMITKGVTSAVAKLIAEVTDLSLLRHLLEVFIKPVEGKLQITAGRYMMLESGKKKTGYPIDAYTASMVDEKAETSSDINLCVRSFEKLKGLVDMSIRRQRELYRNARNYKIELMSQISYCKKLTGELQTDTIQKIIDSLWQNPSTDPEAAAGFKELYRNVTKTDEIDWDIMVRFLGPKAREQYENQSDISKKAEWARAIVIQRKQKDRVVKAIKDLALAIRELKQFRLTNSIGYKKLNDVLNNHLPENCVLRGVDKVERFKYFSTYYNLTPAEQKTMYRKLFVELVKAFDIKRSALVGGGLLSKPTVAPEPTAPYDNDAAWEEYVNSIQNLPVKKPSNLKKIGLSFTDPLANMFSAADLKNIFYDDWAYGPSKKGEILFASEDGTMVLDRNIYRANVAGSEDFVNGEGRRVVGYAAKIRTAMMGV